MKQKKQCPNCKSFKVRSAKIDALMNGSKIVWWGILFSLVGIVFWPLLIIGVIAIIIGALAEVTAFAQKGIVCQSCGNKFVIQQLTQTV